MSNTPSQGQSTTDPGVVFNLAEQIERGRKLLSRDDLPPGLVGMWVGRVRGQFRNIYGHNSAVEQGWPLPGSIKRDEARAILRICLSKTELLFASLNEAALRMNAEPAHHRVFIGHGRSLVWLELKDFLQDRLQLPWEEFNRESVPGISTTERLQQMLGITSFAFLIMTAEDEHANSTWHARANVIHEVGLFQGRLGAHRAIILLEEGCEQFSNIHGLSYIPFSTGRLRSAFEDIRRVLERESVI
ncbi:MAG TPA: TIR domain-containing protein [Geobacteraceae bacterium]